MLGPDHDQCVKLISSFIAPLPLTEVAVRTDVDNDDDSE